MDSDSYCTRQTLVTFLAGAALGAVVVALTTPKTGRELREDLRGLGDRARDRASRMADQVGEAWEDVQDSARDLAGRVRTKAGEVAHRAGDAWSDVKRGAANAGQDLKEGAQDAGKALRT